MRVHVLPDATAVAAAAAGIIRDVVHAQAAARMALPTGGTPIAAYRDLARMEQRAECDFSRSLVYAVDEFVGVPAGADGTNASFYRAHLQIHLERIECPDSGAPEPEAEARALAESIRSAGGLDLCVLGVGTNGHVAFNEPGSTQESRARVVWLEEASRRAHADAFSGLELVPTRGMTLGVGDILEARQILVLAQGDHKAKVVRDAIEGPQTAALPASWLQSHERVTWLLDEAAASRLSQEPRRSSESI